MIIIVFGLPGSGKSYFASRLATALGVKYASSDEFRLRMFSRRSYTREEKESVYEALLEAMTFAIERKESIVLDATFGQASIRASFEAVARRFQTPLYYIEITAPDNLIRQRLAHSRPNSEADYAVHLQLRDTFESLRQDHLVLTSSDDNIHDMLNIAIHYIRASDE